MIIITYTSRYIPIYIPNISSNTPRPVRTGRKFTCNVAKKILKKTKFFNIKIFLKFFNKTTIYGLYGMNVGKRDVYRDVSGCIGMYGEFLSKIV